MSQDLAIIEQQLRPLTPQFAELLAPTGLPPERLIRTVMVSLERTPRLLECTRSSIIQSAMTAAVLGLEADGATGQFFMIPFKDKAQPVIGYKGYNTLAGRSGFTINGAIVREGDFFEYELGSAGYMRHRPVLGAGRNRRIVGGWASASRPGHAPIVDVLDIDDILFVKQRSPGARKSDSPWNDTEIGFPAMAVKTVKRRLARSLPMNLMVTAAAMEEAHEEQGHHSFIHPEKGLVIDGEAREIGPAQPAGGAPTPDQVAPRKFIIHKKRSDLVCNTIEEWRGRMMHAIGALSPDSLIEFRDLNAAEIDTLYREFPDDVKAVGEAMERKIGGH